LSRNLGALTSWNPLGHSRPVTGQLYLFTNTFKQVERIAQYIMYCVLSDNLSTKHIFTTELVEGIPVDRCVDMDLETRQHISRLVMGLFLKELFEFRYMQTDPNWSNFLYNPETRQVKLSINLGINEVFVNTVAS